MIALDLYVGENALANHHSSPEESACTRCVQMSFHMIRKPKRKRSMSTHCSVAGLKHIKFGGVVARPLYGERLTVGILDFEALT
jgi:hypothetical protein